MLRSVMDQSPQLGEEVFVAETAVLAGDVRVGRRASIWYGAVLRGDIHHIEIGEESNIQDNAVVHVEGNTPARIGRRVTVGHGAVIHACTVEDECLIGMGAVVLDGAHIGQGSLVAAGAVVTPGTRIPPGSLVTGTPARVKRPLTADEQAGLRDNARRYVRLSESYRS